MPSIQKRDNGQTVVFFLVMITTSVVYLCVNVFWFCTLINFVYQAVKVKLMNKVVHNMSEPIGLN